MNISYLQVQSNHANNTPENIQGDISKISDDVMIQLVVEQGLYIHVIFKDDPVLYKRLSDYIMNQDYSKAQVNKIFCPNFIDQLISQPYGTQFIFDFFENYPERDKLRPYLHEQLLYLNEINYIKILKKDPLLQQTIKKAGYGGPYKNIKQATLICEIMR